MVYSGQFIDVQFYGRYLREQLKKYRSNFYKLDEAEFWALNSQYNFHKGAADLPLGLDEIEFFAKEYFGQSGVYDGVGTDIPVVDVQIGRLGKVPTAIFINSGKWNYFDLQKQKVAANSGTDIPRMNLVAETQTAAGEFLNRREHYTILYGMPERGLWGIYNQPNVEAFNWDTKLYDETAVTPKILYMRFLDIIQMFMEKALITNSKLIEIKVPEKLMKRLAEPYNDVSGTTVYEMLTGDRVGYGISRITSARENEGQNLINQGVFDVAADPSKANRDRIIWKTTTEVMERSFYARNSLPVFQLNSMTWEQVFFSATTGVFTPRKNRMMYTDFLNN